RRGARERATRGVLSVPEEEGCLFGYFNMEPFRSLYRVTFCVPLKKVKGVPGRSPRRTWSTSCYVAPLSHRCRVTVAPVSQSLSQIFFEQFCKSLDRQVIDAHWPVSFPVSLFRAKSLAYQQREEAVDCILVPAPQLGEPTPGQGHVALGHVHAVVV